MPLLKNAQSSWATRAPHLSIAPPASREPKWDEPQKQHVGSGGGGEGVTDRLVRALLMVFLGACDELGDGAFMLLCASY